MKITEITTDNTIVKNWGRIVLRTQGTDQGSFIESTLVGPCSLFPGGHEVAVEVLYKRELRTYVTVNKSDQGGMVDSYKVKKGQVIGQTLDIPGETEKVLVMYEGE